MTCQDVLADPDWMVNELETLSNTGYHWYTLGLPLWPLPHQELPNTTPSKPRLLGRKKPVDWPNYGLATPIYYASTAWRNPVSVLFSLVSDPLFEIKFRVPVE